MFKVEGRSCEDGVINESVQKVYEECVSMINDFSSASYMSILILPLKIYCVTSNKTCEFFYENLIFPGLPYI